MSHIIIEKSPLSQNLVSKNILNQISNFILINNLLDIVYHAYAYSKEEGETFLERLTSPVR